MAQNEHFNECERDLQDRSVPLQAASAAAVPVAIVGFAFRFPGDLADESAFWEALKLKRDLAGR